MRRSLVALVLLVGLWAQPADAAYTLIASTSKASAGANDAVTTNAIDVTGADLILVGVAFNLTNLGAISDSQSNVYSSAENTAGAAEGFAWSYKQAPSTSAAFTVTAGAVAQSYQTVYVYAFSGSAASPLDQHTGASFGAGETSQQPGSVTPTEDDELVVTGITLSNTSGGVSINGGFSTPIAIDTATTNMPSAVAYLIQTTAAAANPTWSWTNSVRAVASIVTFKAGSVAASTTHNLLLLGVGK